MPLPLPEYDTLDAVALAALIDGGDLGAAEVTDAALARAGSRGRSLGAFAHLEPGSAAREQAASAPSGPLHGVPYPIKDLGHAVAGMPHRSGSAAYRYLVPDADTTYVERARAAGLVLIGKTAVPEFGLVGVTEPNAYDPARNPWAPTRTPGGSSGGAAAAVAARVVPAADATDGGGSIRIPASFCGLFGLKPSRGRVPEGPLVGESWHGAVASLAVTRSVRDAAALLDAVAGPAPGDPVALPRPSSPFAGEVGQDPGRLKIGWTTRSPLGTPVDPACVAAVEDAASLLADLGHHVEPAEPEVDGRAVARGYLTMYFGQCAATLRRMEDERAGSSRETEVLTRLLARLGESMTAGQYAKALDEWNVLGRAVGAFHEQFDLYLTPTVAALPSKIGAQQPTAAERALMRVAVATRSAGLLLKTGFVDQMLDERLAPTPFTQLANLTGLPAMSVPLSWTDPLPDAPRGLPVGVQFVGRPRDESTLLRLAAQLEAARPWAHRRPALADDAA